MTVLLENSNFLTLKHYPHFGIITDFTHTQTGIARNIVSGNVIKTDYSPTI